MTLRCSVIGHAAATTHHRNQGLDFASCHRCGCDLIRSDGGEWRQVPAGFRVVWREFGRAGDAASVADRMARLGAPARRRGPRNARPAPHRDPRGRPLASAGVVFASMTRLGRLVDEVEEDIQGIEPSGQYVICLPSLGTH